jgi:hypothetical protein
MAQSALVIRNVHQDEVEDFQTELRRARRSADEFDVAATPQQLDNPPHVSPLRGTITIKHRKSGAARTYDTGHATNWVARFSEDLQTGIFG